MIVPMVLLFIAVLLAGFEVNAKAQLIANIAMLLASALNCRRKIQAFKRGVKLRQIREAKL